jgi:hypothetical protein
LVGARPWMRSDAGDASCQEGWGIRALL